MSIIPLFISLSVPNNLIGTNSCSDLCVLSLSHSFIYIFWYFAGSSRVKGCYLFLWLASPCLVVLKLHPPDHPGALIQNHVSYWWFPALVPQGWWGWLGSASCCQVTWVFICLSRHEAHISSSHRWWATASIPPPFQSAVIPHQPVLHQDPDSQNPPPACVCREP